jgi:hypothetical protein
MERDGYVMEYKKKKAPAGKTTVVVFRAGAVMRMCER